jgi:hypothetical protein
MNILKSYQEVIEMYNGDLSNICQVAFDKKNNQHNFHAGHDYMLDRARETGKDILISFNHVHTFVKNFYKNNKYKDTGQKQEANYLSCYNWCKERDVELFWWLEDSVIRNNSSDHDKNIIWVEEFWNDNDLGSYITSINKQHILIERIKARMIYKRDCQLNWTVLSSWKDGYVRVYDKWFSDRYSKEDFRLVEPILNDKGVYYSRHDDIYNDDESNVLNELKDYAQVTNRDNLQDIYKKLYRKLYIYGIKLKDITILSEKLLDLPLTQFTVVKNNVEEIYPFVRSNNE